MPKRNPRVGQNEIPGCRDVTSPRVGFRKMELEARKRRRTRRRRTSRGRWDRAVGRSQSERGLGRYGRALARNKCAWRRAHQLPWVDVHRGTRPTYRRRRRRCAIGRWRRSIVHRGQLAGVRWRHVRRNMGNKRGSHCRNSYCHRYDPESSHS